MKKIAYLLTVAFLIFISITSCSNFVKGSDLIDEIDEKIQYNNAPYVKVTIASNQSATKSIEPSNGIYENKYKKTDTINLNFEEANDYQFTKWSVEPVNSVKFITDRTITENIDQLQSVKAVIQSDSSDIKITANTYKRPTADFSPKNIVSVPKNTAIIIEFSNKIVFSQEQINNKLNDIKITMDGIDLRNNNYYQDPILTENSEGNTKILFEVNRNNLLQLSSSEANITVTIPENIYYLTDDGFKINSTKELKYTFMVNNQTLDYIDINIISSSNQGAISSTGSKRYYLDDEFTLTFDPISEYTITGWNIFKNYNQETGTGDDVDITIIDRTISADNKSIHAKILTGTTDVITITPKLEISKYIEASFNDRHGDITPSETKRFYSSDTFNISFKEEKNYYFTNWTIWDKDINRYLTNDEMSSIFEAGTFDINKDEQQIKIKKLTQNYRIEFNVEVLERPQVLSVTPTNSPDGTYRDSTIQVMFDHAVDEDSIYFTPTDIAELKVKNNLTDSDFISTIVHGNQKYYAYRYNNQLFYKNITIQDYKTGANIIEKFGIPYFDGNTILLIPTNDNNLPTPGTFVFVTILSDFYYTDSSKPITLTKHVTMPEPKKWDYLVNSRVDSAPPTFNENQIIFKRKLNNGTYENMTSPKTNDNVQFTTQEELLNNFTLLNDLKLAISISDNYGSGPKSITYKIHNLDTDTYTDNITLDITIIGTEAGFGTYDNDNLQPLSLDLTNLSGITLNGTNTIQFTGTDQKNNSVSSKYYYFYVDADAPKFDINNPPQITLDSSLNSNFLISWQNPQDLDFDKVVIEYKEKDSTIPATIINDIERTATSKILELENGKTYDIKVYPTDIFGNKENVDSIYKNTAPGTIQNLITNINENSPNAITISWTKSNGNYKGANIYWSNTADFTPNPLDENHKVTVIATENTLNYTYTLASLLQGSKYYFKVCAYDEFNISNYISDNGIIVKPANITNLLAQKDENSPSNQINLSWTNPVDNYTGLKIYKKTRNETSYPSTPDYIITDGSTSKSFTGLTGGTIYDFNIVSYINIDNEETLSDNNIISCNTYINNASNFTTENTNNSTNSIVLNWTNPVGNFTGVKIYKKEINSEYDSTYINITDHSSTYVYEGLSGGKKYVFKLVPYVNIDNQDFTATELEQSAITYPNSIQNIYSISADNTTNTIKLNWTNPTDKFDGIKAYYKLSEDPHSNYQQFTTITDTTPSKNMNETYSGFAAGTQYEFKFVPYVNFDNTDYLAVGKTTITNTIPNNVTQFSISKNITTPTTQIDLTWTNPTGSYTFIRIYKKLHDSQDSYEQIATINNLITHSYTVQNLDIASYYDFKVETVKQFNNGSDTISSEITSSYATSPESVTDFTANHNSSKKLYLTWTNPSSNFDGNMIYAKLHENTTWNKLKDLQNKNNNITLTGLAAGNIYDFKITPYIKIDENYYYANEETVNTFSYPNSVKDLTSTRDSTNPSSSINLSWTQLYGNAAGIDIYYSTDDNTYTKITTSGPIKLASSITSSSTSCKIINLTGGTKYYFKVQPYIIFNSDYKYAESKTTSQTALNNITNFVASRNSNNPSTEIDLSWTNPQGNFTGNTVYYKLSSASTWIQYRDIDNITANNITISGLTDNKEYNFKVVPYILDGSTKNTYENPTIINSYTAPLPVTNFSSSYISSHKDSEIKLTWINPSYTSLPTRIIKFKKTSDTVYKTITLDNNANEYIIHDHNKNSYQNAQLAYETLDAGTTYNIQIMTVNNGIESTIQELNHTTAPKSLGLKIEEDDTEQTSFKIWIKKYDSNDKLITTITENYDGVRLYYKKSTDPQYTLKQQWTKQEFLAAEDPSLTSGFTYVFTGLSIGTTYNLKIVSYINKGDNSSLESQDTEFSIRTIGDLTISNINVTKVPNTNGSVSKLKLTWNPPSDIPSDWKYKIYAYSSAYEGWVDVGDSSVSNITINISTLKSNNVVSETPIPTGTVIKFKIGFEKYGLDNATDYDFEY